MVGPIGSIGQVGNKAWELTRKHPMPATLIGVGLGWLLVERIRATDTTDLADYPEGLDEISEDLATSRLASAAGAVKDAANHAVDSMKDATSHAFGTVKDATTHAVETVKDATSHTVETLKETASDLNHQAHETAAHLKSTARQAKMSFWQTMEENPLAVGATILTLGAIAGFALPSTRKEDALMGETRDNLFSSVRDAGHEVVESFQTN
jgi:hypothetical protein